MKHVTSIMAALVLAACATTPETTAIREDDPVQDFIQLHNLEEVAVIRGFENPGVLYMEDPRYIIAYLRDDQWLLEYAHECRLARLESWNRPPDKRRYTRVLYVNQDTFRGCAVKAMYPISVTQAQELVTIGQDPEGS